MGCLRLISSVILFLFGIVSWNLGFMDIMDFIVVLALFGCAGWVLYEMEDKFDMGYEKASKWAVGVLFLWPIIFPYYLIKRKDFLKKKL